MPKAPEWLNADIQEFYPTCQGNIRAIQQAIREKRGVEIAYMTISDRLKRLGLERPRDKRKQPKVGESPAQETSMPEDVVEILPGQLSIEDADTAADRAVSVSAIADIVPVHDITEHLSPSEVRTLEHYEQIIAQGIKTFVQVGHALLTIREQRLYRESYATFEDYCRQRWDLSRPYAYQLIEASQVVDRVSAIADIVPANEAQARPLVSLRAEQQAPVWREVVDTAPPSGITAKHVKETVNRVKGKLTGASLRPKSQAEETRERIGERGQPNSSWINVLSQAHRLCSSLARLPERDEVFTSWGPEGRQKAIEYLEPLYKDIALLLQRLTVTEGSKPFANE